ncbi:MAG TPA: hypothetical protein VGG72_08710 [Bryobacteraceae bacterium]|jgi:hypothetical protein
MRFPGYLIYSMLLLTGTTLAEFRGWTLDRPNQVNNVPKTVRDNPGAYRAIYGFYPRYVGGK